MTRGGRCLSGWLFVGLFSPDREVEFIQHGADVDCRVLGESSVCTLK